MRAYFREGFFSGGGIFFLGGFFSGETYFRTPVYIFMVNVLGGPQSREPLIIACLVCVVCMCSSKFF